MPKVAVVIARSPASRSTRSAISSAVVNRLVAVSATARGAVVSAALDKNSDLNSHFLACWSQLIDDGLPGCPTHDPCADEPGTRLLHGAI